MMGSADANDADAMAAAIAEHGAASRPPVIPADVAGKRHAPISDALRAAGELLRRIDRDWTKKPPAIARDLRTTREAVERELAHANKSGSGGA